MIIIYGKDNCPYCDMAKSLATRKGHTVEYKQLGVDFEYKDLMEKFPTARTFPQIIIDGTSIGGYTELENLID
jgi:glutaredoxin